MRYTLFTILFVIIAFVSSGQKEARHWFFGSNAGLDFTTGTAISDPNGALVTSEGCATISDSLGNLLFYTDGSTVYNRNHVMMANGDSLTGDVSTAQSAIIVPQPQSTFYYIFTLDNNAGPDGLRYSVVDMAAQGGLGEVTGQKNILLMDSTTEQISATKAANCEDFWIMAHEWNSDAYYAYNITSAGLNTTPVITNIGPVAYSNQYGFSWGYAKFSPDGKKFAMPFAFLGLYELYDFNNVTGELKNPIRLQTGNTFGNYGTEFSPDGSMLYTSITGVPGKVFQWNLLAGSEAAVNSTYIRVATSSSQSCGAIQLGPDGKIYFARHNGTYLGVINYPNVPGTGCDYVDDGVFIGGALRMSRSGLPSFVQSFLYPISNSFEFENTCQGEPVDFFMADSLQVDSITWDFDDPTSGSANHSEEINTTHIFDNPGSYSVTANIHFCCTSKVVTKLVTISPRPFVDLGGDTAICSATNYVLDAFTNGATYSWQDSSTNSSYTVTSTGTFWVEVDLNGCVSSDTINVTNSSSIDIAITDTLATECDRGGGVVDTARSQVTGGTPPYTYLWNTNPPQTTPNAIGLSESVIYTLTVTDANGCIKSESVSIKPLIQLSASVNHNTCGTCADGDATVYIAGNGTPPYTYRWSDPKEQTTVTADSLPSGTYIITVTDTNGCFQQLEVYLGVVSIPESEKTVPITLYPNPTTGELNVSGLNHQDQIKISIYNSLGSRVSIVSDKAKFNLQALKPGVYYIDILNGEKHFFKKIIKR